MLREAKKLIGRCVIIIEIVGAAVVALLVGGFGGYMMRKQAAEQQIGSAEEEAKRIVRDAEEKGEAAKKMKLLEAWIEIHRDDLEANWKLLSNGEQFFRIDPLR